MKPGRIEALSDGIFAIVMTLLVLELKVPLHSLSLSRDLLDLWPKVLAFVISFAILGIYWTSHHIQFIFIKKSNFNHMWLNMIFLLFVCLVPFSAALLGEYPLAQLPQIIYGLNLVACALSAYIQWYYARRKDLVEHERISDELIRNARHKMLLPALLYMLGVLVSFRNPSLSLLFFALGPVIYFIPVDSRLWSVVTNPFHG